jgi:hypothetical protein
MIDKIMVVVSDKALRITKDTKKRKRRKQKKALATQFLYRKSLLLDYNDLL